MSECIKGAITKGIAKVPMIMQMENLECGAACLCMILAYYGKWISLEEARDYCGVSRDGSNALNILKAAKYYGLEAHGYRFSDSSIKTECEFPCIIHWNYNHFVVLRGFKNGKAYINDPGNGAYSVTMEEFEKSFTGVGITFVPTKSFELSGKPKSVLEFARKRLKGTRPALVFAILISFIAAMMKLVKPAFSKVFLDYILSGSNTEWFKAFVGFIALFGVIELIVSTLQAIYSLRISGKMTAIGSASYFWKILNLPMKFFSQRLSGDIKRRQSLNASISGTLINIFAPLAINGIMVIFYLTIMLRYSVMLTAIGLTSLVLCVGISIVLLQKRINYARVSMQSRAKLDSTTIAGIELIETIKSSGAINGFFKKWSGYQARINNLQMKMYKESQLLTFFSQVISTLSNSIVLVLGVWMTMQGQFTIGMIMAFQGFQNSFMSPAIFMLNAGQNLQEMKINLEFVEDVMEYPEDSVFGEEAVNEDEKSFHNKRKLSGIVELKDVEFGYAPLNEPLVKNFSMRIEAGKCVAIVGESGCGKSTILKLLTGLYKPWKGDILYDGQSISDIPKSTFTSSISVVDQEIVLFNDTIANNIKLWDESIEDFEMILAAHDAQIHESIMERTRGYQYKLEQGGTDFSGGQRQCLEIARALAIEPSILILDEATNSLDVKTEERIIQAIRKRGITSIIIAHRLSSIKNCDEIFVMDNGELVAQGTHEELMTGSSVYQKLVYVD